MILVTTSRKPLPPIRTLAKDLAFAAGVSYVPRGKTGIFVLLEESETVIVVSGGRAGYSIDLYSEGELDVSVLFSSFKVNERDGPLVRGLVTGNRAVYEGLRRYLDVLLSEDGNSTLSFDGAQRRRNVLSVRDDA